MGCTASKQDAAETNLKSRSGNRSMLVHAQGNSDNGYHMVALTSSTYGILKVDDPKTSVSSSNASHDAFLEKLKHFDVPDEMHAKSWSEVVRHLPKIPPPTRTDSPLRMNSPRLQARGLDSPRLQTRGLDSPRLQTRGLDSPRLQTRGLDSPRLQGLGSDSPRQNMGTSSPRVRGSFRRTGSLPSQVNRNDHETINTWELMHGLDENGNALEKPKLKPVGRTPDSPSRKPFGRSATFSTIQENAFEKPKLKPVGRTPDSPSIKPFGSSATFSNIHGNTFEKPKLKPVGRIPSSPSIKPIERSVTFSTIHTLSEFDTGDPSKAIALGPAGNILNSSNSVDNGGKENNKFAVRVVSRSASSPTAPVR